MPRFSGTWQRKFFDLSLLLMLLGLMLVLVKRRVEASTESRFENLKPTPTPKQPRTPPRPSPLPFINPTDKIWITQGEMLPGNSGYFCRVACRGGWEKKTFEVLQSTRGAEDWNTHHDEISVCSRVPAGGANPYLDGGLWLNPPALPDESLCFLVIREIATRPER
ncbi:MAG: hypothetical protein RI953_1439 [Pseudomonadota bacterium]|jgi:hypothetical protein